MIRLTLCYSFYRNQGMLAAQYRVWSQYPEALKPFLEAIVIDDSSPEPAVDVPRPAGLPAVTIGRLSEVADPMTPPWRQDAARNRAAHEAQGEWLFLSDMDHVLPAASLIDIFTNRVNGPDVVYSFQRLDAPNLTPKLDKQGRIHPHPNTYLMKKSRYWTVGGYDEDYGGIYGTDGPFRKKLLDQSTLVELRHVPIVRYPREVIPDASTRTDRKQFKNPSQVARIAERRAQKIPPSVLTTLWTKQVSA